MDQARVVGRLEAVDDLEEEPRRVGHAQGAAPLLLDGLVQADARDVLHDHEVDVPLAADVQEDDGRIGRKRSEDPRAKRRVGVGPEPFHHAYAPAHAAILPRSCTRRRDDLANDDDERLRRDGTERVADDDDEARAACGAGNADDRSGGRVELDTAR